MHMDVILNDVYVSDVIFKEEKEAENQENATPAKTLAEKKDQELEGGS